MPEPKPRRYGTRKKPSHLSGRDVLSTATAEALARTQIKWEPLLTRALVEQTVEGQVQILASLYKISRTAGRGVWSALIARWTRNTGRHLAEEAYAEFMRRKTTGKKKT